MITISNPSEPVTLKDGLPRSTSKRNHALHGWGLQNVVQLAEKYNGSVQCRYENGRFEAAVLLFFPEPDVATGKR